MIGVEQALRRLDAARRIPWTAIVARFMRIALCAAVERLQRNVAVL
jgi:hypothetical protein